MECGAVSDIRDWGAFIRGRWNWTRGGYEKDFPRGCQFTDIDAAVEFDGYRLLIEPKHFDGEGELPELPPLGQLRFLRDEAKLGKAVFVLYGCGACNDPWGVRWISEPCPPGGPEFDWRDLPKAERRARLKRHIDWALGLSASEVAA